MYVSESDAREAFRKCSKTSIFNLFLRKDDELMRFKDIQEENKAFTSTFVGLKNVPLEEIVGSVEKVEDFNKEFAPRSEFSQERWCRIYKEMLTNGNLPPVELYKIKDQYFVYDGNHRVSVAKYLKFRFIEAEVHEFFPNKDYESDKIFQERFAFEMETGIETIKLESPMGYNLLRDEIREFSLLTGREDEDLKSVGKAWFSSIFNPVVDIFRRNFPKNIALNGEIFIDFLFHKKSISKDQEYSFGYTISLVDYINRVKLEESNSLETDILLDRLIINEFRKIYDVDKLSFYKDEFRHKIMAIREFKRRRFKRESLVIGEIELYRKIQSIPGFILAMQSWFENVYDSYEMEFKDKLKITGIYTEIRSIGDIGEDIVRFSRYYRKKYNRLLTNLEIVLSYILDIFIPANQLINERGFKEAEAEERYFTITQSYLYYIRYGGTENLREFVKNYMQNSEENSFRNLIFNGMKKEESGDIFRDIKQLILYYSNSSFEGKQDIDDFEKIMNRYDGTERYETATILKRYLIQVKERENYHGNFVEDILKKELEYLTSNKEIKIIYNNKRVLNVIKGAWKRYTFIDYYTYILKYKEENETIEDVIDRMNKLMYRY